MIFLLQKLVFQLAENVFPLAGGGVSTSKYMFLLVRRLFSTSGKPVLKCSELCFSLQILTIEKFSLMGRRSLFLQLIFTNSHVNDFLTITTFPLSGNMFHN